MTKKDTKKGSIAKTEKKVSEPKEVPVPSRIHIAEFLEGSGLSDMHRASFGVLSGGKAWMFPKEWEKLLEEFKKRIQQ